MTRHSTMALATSLCSSWVGSSQLLSCILGLFHNFYPITPLPSFSSFYAICIFFYLMSLLHYIFLRYLFCSCLSLCFPIMDWKSWPPSMENNYRENPALAVRTRFKLSHAPTQTWFGLYIVELKFEFVELMKTKLELSSNSTQLNSFFVIKMMSF